MDWVVTRETSSEEETSVWARELAAALVPGDVVALEGTLGAGKTALARALCDAWGVPPEAGFASPSYALMHLYEGGAHPVAHLDLYRLGGDDELEGLGFRDYLEGDWVVLVEWPERCPALGESITVRVQLNDTGPSTRRIQVGFRDPQRNLADRAT